MKKIKLLDLDCFQEPVKDLNLQESKLITGGQTIAIPDPIPFPEPCPEQDPIDWTPRPPIPIPYPIK